MSCDLASCPSSNGAFLRETRCVLRIGWHICCLKISIYLQLQLFCREGECCGRGKTWRWVLYYTYIVHRGARKQIICIAKSYVHTAQAPYRTKTSCKQASQTNYVVNYKDNIISHLAFYLSLFAFAVYLSSFAFRLLSRLRLFISHLLVSIFSN